MSIKSFHDLDVWKAAVDLATRTYRETCAFPSEERFGLTSQMRRAATSVAANIAEGHARNGTREFLHFVSIALGSLAELETECEIAMRCGLLETAAATELLKTVGQVRGLLLSLRMALARRARGVQQDLPEYDAAGACDGAGPLPPAPCPAPDFEARAG